jgi:hypothetical protein
MKINKIMNITFTDVTAFVLTFRNKANNKFYIRPKSDILREEENKKSVISMMNEGVFDESNIIERINNGTKFYTYSDGNFTEVTVVENNLKTVKNLLITDNILELPLLEK